MPAGSRGRDAAEETTASTESAACRLPDPRQPTFFTGVRGFAGTEPRPPPARAGVRVARMPGGIFNATTELVLASATYSHSVPGANATRVGAPNFTRPSSLTLRMMPSGPTERTEPL